MVRFFTYCFGLPIVLTLLPFTTKSYGDSGSWCWIKNDAEGKFWRFFQFYLPLWVCMTYNAKVSWDLRVHIERLRTHLSMIDRGQNSEARLPAIGGVFLFPLVLLFCWTFATVNRVQNMADPDHPQAWLFVLHVLFGNAQGLFHGILFASTSAVQREWAGVTRGAPEVDGRSLVGDSNDDGTDDDDVGGKNEDEEEETKTKKFLPRRRGSSSMLADMSYKVRAAYQLQLGVYDMFGIMNYDDSVDADDLAHALAGYAYQTEEIKKREDRKRLREGVRDSNISDDNDDDDGHGGGGGKTSTFGAFFTLFKSFVGLGVLALPSAFRESGYVLGSVLLIAIAVISYFCMKLLLDCKYMILEKRQREGTAGESDDSKVAGASEEDTEKSGDAEKGAYASLTKKRRKGPSSLTFGEVGNVAIGNVGKRAVELSMCAMQIGAGVGYLIFIGENIASVAEETGSGFDGAKETMIALFAGASIPLVWLKTIKHLVIPALVADVIIVFGLVTIFGFDFARLRDVHESAESWRMRGIPLFFGIAVFAFEGIGMVLPVESAMEDPSRFGGVLRKTMALLTTIFLLIGAISYGAYAEETEDIILFNLPQSNKLVQSVQVLYCVGIFMTLPVMLFPALRILERYAYFQQIFRGHQKTHRTAVVILSAAVAMAVPKFGLFINVVGAVAGSLLAFILPSIFYMQLNDQGLGWRDWRCLGALVFGVVGGAVSLVVSIIEFVK
eukprot:g3397.t1